MKNLTAILIGATGATGTEILNQLLNDKDFTKIIVFTRRAIEIVSSKLEVHVVDFNQINDWKYLIKGDVLFSVLGTTLKAAGTKENQFKIDYTFQFETAKAASENGVSNFILGSSYGAKKNSVFFYPKIKGLLDDAVQSLEFKQIHIFRPGFLRRQPSKLRAPEKVSITIIDALNKIGLFKNQKPIPVKTLAEKMILVSKMESSNKTQIHSLNKIFYL